MSCSKNSIGWYSGFYCDRRENVEFVEFLCSSMWVFWNRFSQSYVCGQEGRAVLCSSIHLWPHFPLYPGSCDQLCLPKGRETTPDERRTCVRWGDCNIVYVYKQIVIQVHIVILSGINNNWSNNVNNIIANVIHLDDNQRLHWEIVYYSHMAYFFISRRFIALYFIYLFKAL